MVVFVDTNILLPAIVFPGSMADRALQKSLGKPYQTYTSDYVLEELSRVISKKFPDKAEQCKRFVTALCSIVSVVQTPEEEAFGEMRIRDEKDRAVFRAAKACGADVILTDDKDFLDAKIDLPGSMSAIMFLEL